jgi:uncharacterized protein (TIRG00374 family)
MRRLISLFVSAAILALLWWKIDIDAILAAFRTCDLFWLTCGLAAIVPLTLITAWRFLLLTRSGLGFAAATRLILSASTLNMLLPSKMGDVAKSWVLTKRYGFDWRHALTIVIFEKLLDLGALLVWGTAALIWMAHGETTLILAALANSAVVAVILLMIAPSSLASAIMLKAAKLLPRRFRAKAADFADKWLEVSRWFWSEPGRAIGTLAVSLALWAAHLAQFWFFAKALGSGIGMVDNMAFATLSIEVGLLPFTMAGIGTRDAAIVYFYRAWVSPAQGAALGVLATSRYLIPALFGLPFISDYWNRKQENSA